MPATDDEARRQINVDLPSQAVTPLRKIMRRLAVALGLIVFVALVTYIGRDGYYDPEDDEVSLLDAFYYSTVSITTTGYGDIRPVTDEARLMTTDPGHPGAGTVPDPPGRHDAGGARRAQPSAPSGTTAGGNVELTHHRLRLRHQGKGRDPAPCATAGSARPTRSS